MVNAEVAIHNLDLMMESNSGTTGIYAGQLTITGNNYVYAKNTGSTNTKIAIQSAVINIYGNLNIDMKCVGGYGLSHCSVNAYENSNLQIASSTWAMNCNDRNYVNFFDNSKLVVDSGNFAYNLFDISFNDQSTAIIKASNLFYIQASSREANINITSSLVQLNIYGGKNLIVPSSSGTNFKAVKGAQIIFNGTVYEINDDVDEKITTSTTVPPNSTVVATGAAEPAGLDDMLAENSSRVMEYQADKTNKKYSEQYKKILEEYDNLLSDSSYQGINLLKGGNLEVTFNESRSNQYTVAGVLADSMSLGLETRNLEDVSSVKKSLEEITKAVNSIRSFQEELGNHYSIIKTRIDFTEALTDILETGADNLTLADMNEASAEYLTLQTRQQLAINSLSLASQAARSVLSLF